MRMGFQPPATPPGGASVAQVTFSEGDGYGAVAAAEQRGLPVFAPRGVAYRPCQGDSVLLVPAGGANVCAGVLSAAADLAPGELRLSSAGGAVIHLLGSGDIVLNGVMITKAGEIIPPGGERGEADGYVAGTG